MLEILLKKRYIDNKLIYENILIERYYDIYYIFIRMLSLFYFVLC